MQNVIRYSKSAIGLSSVLLSLMDACWIYIVAWLFSSVILSAVALFPVPQPLLLSVLELGGWFLAGALLRRGGLSDLLLRAIVGAVGVALALFTAFYLNPLDPSSFTVVYFMPFVFTFLLAMGVWTLGGLNASEGTPYELVYFRFRLGVAAISGAVLFSSFVAREKMLFAWNGLLGPALLFFGAGLSALALSNRDIVRREGGHAGLRSWGWMLAASVGAILLLGLFAQPVGAGNLMSALQNGVMAVLLAIAGVMYFLMLIVLLPFSLCGIQVQPAFNPPPQASQTARPIPTNPFEEFQRQNEGRNPINIPVEWQVFFVALAALLVVACALYLMLRWLRATRQAVAPLLEEEHERFGSWDLFLSQLRAWLDRLLARFRKPAPVPPAPEEDDLASLRGRADMAGTLTVRQIYASLLREARTAGYPRLPHQTPSEYMVVLSRSLPDLRPDFEAITAAYLEARYSPYPASPMSVNAANEAWRKLEGLVSAPQDPHIA